MQARRRFETSILKMFKSVDEARTYHLTKWGTMRGIKDDPMTTRFGYRPRFGLIASAISAVLGFSTWFLPRHIIPESYRLPVELLILLIVVLLVFVIPAMIRRRSQKTE